MRQITQGEDIRARHQALKQEQPHIRARNAAEELGISECELLVSRVGEDVVRLGDDAVVILKDIVDLGEVMALTRNEDCVHERKGVYLEPKFFRYDKMHTGLFVNPDIDLRLFMTHWKFSFAVTDQSGDNLRRSLQFFDKQGQAIHKIYLTEKSNTDAYDALIEKHRHDQQDDFVETENYEAKDPDRDDDQINWSGFRDAWENLKDTHDFFPMLAKFKVGREQGFRRIGADFAYQVENNSARYILDLARDNGCEIMVFVGNRGCIQIHTGKVEKLMEHGSWYNVVDPMFNLHLNEDHISHIWVTRKPSADGIITAVEVFDADSSLIATFFGKRRPGVPELELWRDIVNKLPQKEISDVA